MTIKILYYKIYDDDDQIESFPRLIFPIGQHHFEVDSVNEDRRLHIHFPRPFPGLFDATVREIFGDVKPLVLKSFHLFSMNGFLETIKLI